MSRVRIPMRIRTLAAALVVALLAAAGAYTVYWHRLAANIEEGVARWAEARRAEGWAVGYDSLRADGFPGPVRVTLDQPLLARPDGFRWQTGRLVAHVPPHDPGNVRLAFIGAHRLVSPDMPGPVSFVPRQAAGRLRIGTGGSLLDAEARLVQVQAAAPGVALQADALEASLINTPNGEAARLATTLSGLEWQVKGYEDQPLPPRVEALRLRLNVAPVPALGQPPARAAALWQARGGVVEIEELALTWEPLTLEAEGTATLDEALQPAVALEASIGGLGAFVQRLSEAGRIDDGEARTAQTVLALLARPREDGRAVLEAPVAVRDGRLYLGPVAVARVPRVEWGTLTPSDPAPER